MENPRVVFNIQKFRHERESQNRADALQGLILKYAIEENWDVVKLCVRDFKQIQDELNISK